MKQAFSINPFGTGAVLDQSTYEEGTGWQNVKRNDLYVELKGCETLEEKLCNIIVFLKDKGFKQIQTTVSMYEVLHTCLITAVK